MFLKFFFFFLWFLCVYAHTGAEKSNAPLTIVIGSYNNIDILMVGGDFNCIADKLDRNHVESKAASRKKLCKSIETGETLINTRDSTKDPSLNVLTSKA